MNLAGVALGVAVAVAGLSHFPDAKAQSSGYTDWQTQAVRRTAYNLEAGFVRKFSALDSSGEQVSVSAESLANIFPTWGFPPPKGQGITWGFQALDQSQARACVSVEVRNRGEWMSSVTALQKMGYSLAGSFCSSSVAARNSPQAYPAKLNAVKVLNRRQVFVQAILPSSIQVDGLTNYSRSLPSVVLKAKNGAVTKRIVIRRPLSAFTAISVKSMTVRGSGFDASTNCWILFAGLSCRVDISYMADAADYAIGQLHVELSKGEPLVLSLLGQR